jgi:hypothetical protein
MVRAKPTDPRLAMCRSALCSKQRDPGSPYCTRSFQKVGAPTCGDPSQRSRSGSPRLRQSCSVGMPATRTRSTSASSSQQGLLPGGSSLCSVEAPSNCDSTDFVQHSSFPSMPESVPLAYTLTVAACLSETPRDRPTFEELLVLLSDMEREVAEGQYVNSAAVNQVCSGIPSP